MRRSGFGTFELIVSLAIAIPAIAAVSSLLRQSAYSLKQTRQLKEESVNIMRLAGIIRGIAEDADLHPFHIPPRVHRAGNIRFTDGTPNSVMLHRSAMRPDPRSDSITYLRLDILAAQEITHVTITGSNELIIKTCPRFGNSFRPADYNSFLALGPDGFFEITLMDRELYAGEGKTCMQARALPSKSMIAPPPKSYFVRFLLPLKDIYTFYADSKRRLRYIGHRGEQNIENQPVLNNVQPLKLTVAAGQYYQIRAGDDIVGFNRLTRVSFLNFLLNYP